MTTLVLHIGRHKTGSSSLQETLERNREVLKSREVLFPKALPANHSSFFLGGFLSRPELHPTFRAKGVGRDEIRKYANAKLAQIQTEYYEAKPRWLVFSGEDACILMQEEIEAIKRSFDEHFEPENYKIILYTRHPIEHAQSAIQQNVKGNGIRLEEATQFHAKGGALSYETIFNNFASVFGGGAIDVRSFEDERDSRYGLVASFIDSFGVSWDGLEVVRVNKSICSEVTRFISFLYDGPAQSRPDEVVHNRPMRVVLTASDRSILYSLRGSRPNYLSDLQKRELWNQILADVDFLRTKLSIHYEYNDDDENEQASAISGEFLSHLSEEWQRLTGSVREQMVHFLRINSVEFRAAGKIENYRRFAISKRNNVMETEHNCEEVNEIRNKLLRANRAHLVCGEETSLVVEGYPRSGNTLTVDCLNLLGGRELKIAHHTHAVENVLIGKRLGKPVVILFREPSAAILSFKIFSGKEIEFCAKRYVDFYKKVLQFEDEFCFINFEAIVSDFNVAVRAINKYSGLDIPVSGCVSELIENARRLQMARAVKQHGHKHVERSGFPSKEREKMKQTYRSEVEGYMSGHPEISSVFQKLCRIGGNKFSN